MNTNVNGKDTEGQFIFDVPKIIERLKELEGVNSDAELGRIFDVGRAAVGGWRDRNTLPWEKVFTKYGHMDLNWIVYGRKTEESGEVVTRGMLLEELAVNRGKIVQELKMQLAGLWSGIKGLHESAHGPLEPEAGRNLTDGQFP